MVKLSFSIPEEVLRGLGISVSENPAQEIRNLLLTLAKKKEFINTNAKILVEVVLDMAIKYTNLLKKDFDKRSISDYIELFSTAAAIVGVIKNLPLEKHEAPLIQMMETQYMMVKSKFDIIMKTRNEMERKMAMLLLDDSVFAYIVMVMGVTAYILGTLKEEYDKFKEIEEIIEKLAENNLIERRLRQITTSYYR